MVNYPSVALLVDRQQSVLCSQNDLHLLFNLRNLKLTVNRKRIISLRSLALLNS